MNFEKIIEKLETYCDQIFSLAETFIHYYDDLYGYPWGRIQLVGMTCIGFSLWFGVFQLLFQLTTDN